MCGFDCRMYRAGASMTLAFYNNSKERLCKQLMLPRKSMHTQKEIDSRATEGCCCSMPGFRNNRPMQDLQDSVCILYGRQAMGNDQHSVVAHNSVQGFLHNCFAVCVQCRGCLIKQQHSWLADQRPCYSYALLLTSWQRQPTVSTLLETLKQLPQRAKAPWACRAVCHSHALHQLIKQLWGIFCCEKIWSCTL